MFTDPFAIGFLPTGYRLVARLASLPPVGHAIERYIDHHWPGGPRGSAVVRTRLIDDLLGEALTGGAEQMLLLGAGYDSRADRLPAVASMRVYEVDHPVTQTRKRRIIGTRVTPGMRAHVRFVPVDLERDDPGAALRRAGLAPVRTVTVTVWEGVTNYLTAEAVDTTLRWLATATAAGSWVIFTYVDRRVLDGTRTFPGAEPWLRTVREAGEAWTFGFAPGELPGYLTEHRTPCCAS